MPDLSASIPAFSGTAIAGTGARESAREWISNVKMVAGQAGWRDGVVFAVAASKLSGTALKWHRARGKQLETWEKWAEELQKVFPDDESNPLALYERMLRRTQGPRESVVDYFFDKSYLCTKCDVKEDTSQWKNLIIAGLQNANHAAILRLKAASFTTSLELLEAAKSLEAGEAAYLSSHGSHRPPSQGGSKHVSATPEGVETKPKQIAHGSAVRAAEPKCYRCRKYGHVVKDCPMPVHRTNNETTKPGAGQPSQYVSASSSSELPNIKYVKTAVVNQKSYDALIDTGSSVCTIKASDAMGCCSCFEEDNLELYGFGQSPVKCLSRFRTTIEIDGVKGENVMLHVVPDTAQHFSVIIGRTWTELPNVAYVKVDDTFKIMDKRDDTFGHLEPFTQNQALKITTKNDVALEPRSVNFIMASVDLEGETDVLYQRKGTMTGSVFHVASKQLSVPVANTSNCEKVLKKGMSLGRVEEVNIDTATLSTTSETTEVKTATAGPIHEKDVATGNDVATKERQDLLKLLNQHRECFATNIEELGCTNLIEMDIVLKEGSMPVSSRPYRTSKEERETIQKKSCDRTAEERALAQNFVLKEGRLFRETEANGKKKLLYVMPKSMRKSLCVKFHGLEGHFGLDRAIAKISETYWFPGMRRYVREHIRRCFECLICKVPSGKEKGLLHPIPPGRRPFETIHADHLGPFVRSKKGNKYILVVIDNLTKYVRLFPSRDTSAKSVIKSCEDFTFSHGLPERIITDRGTCFTSKAFEEFCKARGIQHVLNSTRHPRANGQVERVNRTLVPTIMTTMDGNDQREWDIGLKGVEAFLNTSYNKSTGRTPFEVLYGYNPKFHDGALREIAETEDNVAWTNPEQLQAEVRTRILDSQAKYKKRFDMRHCSGDTLKAGDVVVMRCAPEHTGEPTKTQPRYKGPLVVTEVKPNDTYGVAALKGTRSRHYATTAHISSLKTWSTSNKDVEDFEEPSDESEGASDARMAEC
ncbi:hypothetical protein V5799_030443 [Amblyomma americanum]|uniref:RNA-directed DNA polymerase n=1 Tax=Amblyomma americanum TaxID=6943 RepID=A0AAQ4EN50_AMBAM